MSCELQVNMWIKNKYELGKISSFFRREKTKTIVIISHKVEYSYKLIHVVMNFYIFFLLEYLYSQ